MKTVILTEVQTNELRRAHRSATNKRDADRIKAVDLLSRGKSAREIAEVLMLDEDTVGHYRKRYEAGEIAGLLKFVYKKAKAVPGKANAELQRAYLALTT